MLKPRYRFAALSLALLVISACAIIGAPAPESFTDRVGYALGTHTAVLQSITSAVTLGDITSDRAREVTALADKGRAFIDTSRLVYAAGDVGAANRNLTLAVTILEQLQVYLRGASP
jgi:hypothetical protein